ncbi:MAG: DNA-processing protein DprA [Clostridiales Family XIII bacterium]|jgi:DNA processing protein|nr:DNA-processing protein DprA [Clostridiales Family XIII bacterium]
MMENNGNKIPDVTVVSLNSSAYPSLLKSISNPPRKLYCRGDLSLLQMPAVAVVGARKASEYGKWAAYNMGKTLAEYGIVIISGMACGIDSWAHKGALAAGGKTIAVFGCGVDICYPKSNAGLMEDIIMKGLVISEFESGMHPSIITFPLRNRIISGLSLATVVVEAGLKSGSLITAERAAEQGRYVYAVPGNIDRVSSIGANKLIQDGASLIVSPDDVASDLGFIRGDIIEKRSLSLGEDEKLIFDAIRFSGELTVDELCAKTCLPPQDVNGLVTVLEMKGILETAMGRVFTAK